MSGSLPVVSLIIRFVVLIVAGFIFYFLYSLSKRRYNIYIQKLSNEKHKKPFKGSTQLPLLDEIMYKQSVLYAGFIRTEILNYSQNNILYQTNQVIPKEIISLCNSFFNLNLKLLYKEAATQYINISTEEQHILSALYRECYANEEYFMAYLVIQSLLSSHSYQKFNTNQKATVHNLLANTIDYWNTNSNSQMNKDAIESARTAVTLQPHVSKFRIDLSILLSRENQWSSALTQCLKAIALSPYSAAYTCYCAGIYEALEDYENECKYHKMTIDLDPKNSTYRAKYGMYLFSQCEYKLALVQLKEAINLGYKEYFLEIYLAQCYGELNKYKNATKYYLEAIKTDPNTMNCYLRYAFFLCRKAKDFEESEIYYQKAIELQPSFLVYYQYACALRDYFKDFDQSQKYYLKSLKVCNKFGKLLSHMRSGIPASYGYLLYLMGEYDTALEHINFDLLHLEANPKGGNVYWPHFYRGIVNKTIGNDKEAQESLLQAIKFMKKDVADVMDHLSILKGNDTINTDYYEQCEKLLS